MRQSRHMDDQEPRKGQDVRCEEMWISSEEILAGSSQGQRSSPCSSPYRLAALRLGMQDLSNCWLRTRS